MRKFIPVALAVAIVMIAAVAILTSSKALSFSLSPDNSDSPSPLYSDDMRDNYHFGPDFICMIDENSSIECLGSDEHGVVANAPSLSGFTDIDGGDTYACAYHEVNDFHHCWGSIDRQLGVVPDPTSTEEPEPTIEPTEDPVATAEPTETVTPGATEVPVETVVPTPTAVLTTTPVLTPEPTPVPDPCLIPMPPAGTLPATIFNSWIEECVYPLELDAVADGERYYRWTSFSVIGQPEPWTATLTSPEDTFMLLWEVNDGDEPWTLVDMNDDISSRNNNSRITWTPTQGKIYALDITTYTAETLGVFALTIELATGSAQGSTGQQSMENLDMLNAIPFERRQ